MSTNANWQPNGIGQSTAEPDGPDAIFVVPDEGIADRKNTKPQGGSKKPGIKREFPGVLVA